MSGGIDSAGNKNLIKANKLNAVIFVQITLVNKLLAKTILHTNRCGKNASERLQSTNRNNTRVIISGSNLLCQTVPVVVAETGGCISSTKSVYAVGQSLQNLCKNKLLETTSRANSLITEINDTRRKTIPFAEISNFIRSGVESDFVVKSVLEIATIHTFGDLADSVFLVGANDEACRLTITNLTYFCEQVDQVVVSNHRKGGADNLCDKRIKVHKKLVVVLNLGEVERLKAILLEISLRTSALGAILQELVIVIINSFVFVLNFLTFDGRLSKKERFVNKSVKLFVTASIAKHFHTILPPY